MSKQKRKKLTFWSKYKMPIIAIVAFSAIVYVIIYLVFKENGIFPVGTGLEKSDWLSFLGAYWYCNCKLDCDISEHLL